MVLNWQFAQKTRLAAVFPAAIYLFKVENGNTGAMCEIWLKFPIKIPEQGHCRLSGDFIVNFEQISHCSGISIVGFNQGNAD